MERQIDLVLSKCKHASIVIFGAGKKGRILAQTLLKNNVHVECFFDNDEKKIGNEICGVRVIRPEKINVDGTKYIISLADLYLRKKAVEQLNGLGITSSEIVPYDSTDYEYMSGLSQKEYKSEVDRMYQAVFGKPLKWLKPTTYNEIINWEKIYVRDERRTQLVDKYLVKKWVAEKIGEEHVPKLYGAWDRAEDINFDDLPSAFVLKVNNGSRRNIVVEDKSKLDKAETIEQLKCWMKVNYAYLSLEYQYKDIVPKIICEEYLEGLSKSVYDYQMYCFHGEPKYIWCIKGSHTPECKASFYDLGWKIQEFSYGYPRDNEVAPCPKNLEKMILYSKQLSKDFVHVRIDWYDMPDGRLLLGEMTFSSWSGLKHFTPEKYDEFFGDLIRNPIKKKRKHIGTCRLCGEEKILSFEHVPPYAVFNANSLKKYDGCQVLAEVNESGLLQHHYDIYQRGSGGYYLCESCNSFTGGNYNVSFQKIANEVGIRIMSDPSQEHTGIYFKSSEQAWGRFFRQVMTMFLDISDICYADKELKEYLRNPSNLSFNCNKYKIFMYAVDFKNEKKTKLMGGIEIDSHPGLAAAEITAFPLGFLLLIDGNNNINARNDLDVFKYIGADITSFATMKCDYESVLEATIPLHYSDDFDSILEVLNRI